MQISVCVSILELWFPNVLYAIFAPSLFMTIGDDDSERKESEKDIKCKIMAQSIVLILITALKLRQWIVDYVLHVFPLFQIYVCVCANVILLCKKKNQQIWMRPKNMHSQAEK